jgi:hypothetical protein
MGIETKFPFCSLTMTFLLSPRDMNSGEKGEEGVLHRMEEAVPPLIDTTEPWTESTTKMAKVTGSMVIELRCDGQP